MVITLLFTSEIIIVLLFSGIVSETVNAERLQRQNQILLSQSERYESLRYHIKETARTRHDVRQQLRTLSSFVENGKYDELKSYLAEYTKNTGSVPWKPLCQNAAVDAIAGHYLSRAEDLGIVTDWRFDLSKELPLTESIFCGMLGNLIENAIEGCQTLSSEGKIIRISAEMPSPSMLVLVIENTFDGVVKTDKSGSLMSLKHPDAAIGLSSVQAVTEEYNGQMKVDYDDQTFRVSILLGF